MLGRRTAVGPGFQSAGITQLVECKLPKLDVAGSTPVARSRAVLIPCWRLPEGVVLGFPKIRNIQEYLESRRSVDGPSALEGREAEPSESVVGAHSLFRGEVCGAGPLRIRGRLDGAVRIEGEFIVEAEGRVDANMVAGHATLRGRIEGNLQVAGIVKLETTARFFGDITSERLLVEPGSILQGKAEIRETT